jgi:hypothetical protein
VCSVLVNGLNLSAHCVCAAWSLDRGQHGPWAACRLAWARSVAVPVDGSSVSAQYVCTVWSPDRGPHSPWAARRSGGRLSGEERDVWQQGYAMSAGGCSVQQTGR